MSRSIDVTSHRAVAWMHTLGVCLRPRRLVVDVLVPVTDEQDRHPGRLIQKLI